MDPSDSNTNTAIILEKLEKLASADLIRRMQGQMVSDKTEILTSVAALRTETRTEIASIRASQDVSNTAIVEVTNRVKKLEARSVPPRSVSPMPQRYDLAAASGAGLPPGQAEKLVDRLNELEADQDATRHELQGVLAERDAAKKAELQAQERQAAVQEYAGRVEKKARDEAALAKAELEKAERDAEKRQDIATKKLDRWILIAKLLAIAIPTVGAIVHFIH